MASVACRARRCRSSRLTSCASSCESVGSLSAKQLIVAVESRSPARRVYELWSQLITVEKTSPACGVDQMWSELEAIENPSPACGRGCREAAGEGLDQMWS